MITKPVSKIFNVKGTANGNSAGGSKYDLSSLAEEYIAILDKDGKLAKLTADSANDTMSSLKEFDIYYKDKTGFVHKQSGYKHLYESDVHNVNLKNATNGTPFCAVVKDYKYCCDGEYGFRFVVHNAELDKLFWPNGYYETYMVPIDECCAACGGSTTEDDNVITKGLYNAIVLNEDTWLKPQVIVTAAGETSPTYAEGEIISPSEIDAVAAEGGKTGLLIKIKDANEWNYSQFNFKYTHVRASRFEIGKIAGAQCSVNVVSNNDETFSISYKELEKADTKTLSASSTNATFTTSNADKYSDDGGYLYIEGKKYAYTKSTSTITVTGGAALADTKNHDIYVYGSTVNVQRFVIPQTDGYDLKAVEYQLMGYRENMSPYRLSDVTMTEFGYNYSFEENSMYHVLTVSYEKKSDAATVHMPYPMSIVFAFKNDGGALDTLKGKVANFFGVSNASNDANINLK